MAHGGGWRSLVYRPDEKPQITWSLLTRVMRYAKAYTGKIIGMLLMILIISALNLLTPLIMRDLVDHTIPAGDLNRLLWLAIALLIIPILRGGITIWQRLLNASVGEGSSMI